MKISKFITQGKRSRFVPGDFKVVDDITGMDALASQTSKQWNGIRSAKSRPRHEQDFLRGHKEQIRTPWARPEADDTYAEAYVGTALWQANTLYTAGDVVVWNGVEYTCTTTHTSSYPFDITQWTIETL